MVFCYMNKLTEYFVNVEFVYRHTRFNIRRIPSLWNTSTYAMKGGKELFFKKYTLLMIE